MYQTKPHLHLDLPARREERLVQRPKMQSNPGYAHTEKVLGLDLFLSVNGTASRAKNLFTIILMNGVYT